MINDIAIIVLVIVLAIIFIAIAAYFLQQWLILRRHSSNAGTTNQENATPELVYYEEKLKENYGSELPTTKIKILLAVPGSQDKLILLEPRSTFQNVLRCHSNGWIVWRGELPTTEDVYTQIEWEGGELKAYSESGYFARLDPEKGEIVSYEFAKDADRVR